MNCLEVLPKFLALVAFESAFQFGRHFDVVGHVPECVNVCVLRLQWQHISVLDVDGWSFLLEPAYFGGAVSRLKALHELLELRLSHIFHRTACSFGRIP